MLSREPSTLLCPTELLPRNITNSVSLKAFKSNNISGQYVEISSEAYHVEHISVLPTCCMVLLGSFLPVFFLLIDSLKCM